VTRRTSQRKSTNSETSDGKKLKNEKEKLKFAQAGGYGPQKKKHRIKKGGIGRHGKAGTGGKGGF